MAIVLSKYKFFKTIERLVFITGRYINRVFVVAFTILTTRFVESPPTESGSEAKFRIVVP